MKKSFKYQLKKILPIVAEQPHGNNAAASKYVTISLQRSGQHAVINWICEQMQDIVHFNHCRFERRGYTNWISPINNRVIYHNNGEKRDSGIQSRSDMLDFLSTIDGYRRLLYSFEDLDIEDYSLRKYIKIEKPIVILILRDPYNWLASSIKHDKSSEASLVVKKNSLIKYLEQVLEIRDYFQGPYVDINYNRWVVDVGYRETVCSRLGIQFSIAADKSVMDIQEFGGGSSFDGAESSGGDLHARIFERWKLYSTDEFYRGLLDDRHLADLTEAYFNIENPLDIT